MYINEYQLQVIKRKRIYPEIGDIFRICPRENIEYFGIVVNNHVNSKNEDLLIDPEIVGKEYWTRGYFFNVGHTEICENNYGFYSIGKCRFFDEYGDDIHEEPNLLGTYGVATISGIAYRINQELIIAGII